jgi:uridine phosphorylase
VPSRLRPTAPTAADAILVGDPGRALLLAQELLSEPKMSNHARGLWGYSGRTPAGSELTIQATGMGGPSAALVLADLAKLGLRRAVRVGTCAGLGPATGLGELLLVGEARAEGGSGAAFGVGDGEGATPDPELNAALAEDLGDDARTVSAVSLDTLHPGASAATTEVAAADMQTLALLARSTELGVAVAALLIVADTAGGEQLKAEALEIVAKRAGRAASAVLST